MEEVPKAASLCVASSADTGFDPSAECIGALKWLLPTFLRSARIGPVTAFASILAPPVMNPVQFIKDY